MQPSSDQLHPASGARYVFTRRDDAYEVCVYQAGGATVEATLTWDEDGQPVLNPPVAGEAKEQVLKLARVVKRTGQDRLTRWRG